MKIIKISAKKINKDNSWIKKKTENYEKLKDIVKLYGKDHPDEYFSLGIRDWRSIRDSNGDFLYQRIKKWAKGKGYDDEVVVATPNSGNDYKLVGFDWNDLHFNKDKYVRSIKKTIRNKAWKERRTENYEKLKYIVRRYGETHKDESFAFGSDWNQIIDSNGDFLYQRIKKWAKGEKKEGYSDEVIDEVVVPNPDGKKNYRLVGFKWADLYFNKNKYISPNKINKDNSLIKKKTENYKMLKDIVKLYGKDHPDEYFSLGIKNWNYTRGSDGDLLYQRIKKWAKGKGYDDEVVVATPHIVYGSVGFDWNDLHFNKEKHVKDSISLEGGKTRSMHEVVIRDIFYFVKLYSGNFDFEYEPKNWLSLPFVEKFANDYQSNAETHNQNTQFTNYQFDPPRPDFLINNSILYEVFGGDPRKDQKEYQHKESFKITYFGAYFNEGEEKHFAYIDTKEFNKTIKRERTIELYAEAIDTQSCIGEGVCGQNVLGPNFKQTIDTLAPLLGKAGISVTQHYPNQIKLLHHKGTLDQTRKNVVEKLKGPIQFPTSSRNNWYKIAQESGGYSRTEPVSMEEIVKGLRQEGFWSVNLWSEADQVAMYFKTFENFNIAMNKLDQMLQEEVSQEQNQNKPIMQFPNQDNTTMQFPQQENVAFNLSRIRKQANPPQDPYESELEWEDQILNTDPKTGKQINYIRQGDVEKVLDNFIVDTISGSTLSKMFSLDFEKGSGDLRNLNGMRLVNHPYTRYNLDPELRRGIMGAIKDNDLRALLEIMKVHSAEEMLKDKTKRPKRGYDPDRPRRTRYPITKRQEIRDKHGMVGIYDMNKAQIITKDITSRFGQYFNDRELDLLKSIALVDAYINIYPERVAVIRGNGKMWVIDNSTYYHLLNNYNIEPEFS